MLSLELKVLQLIQFPVKSSTLESLVYKRLTAFVNATSHLLRDLLVVWELFQVYLIHINAFSSICTFSKPHLGTNWWCFWHYFSFLSGQFHSITLLYRLVRFKLVALAEVSTLPEALKHLTFAASPVWCLFELTFVVSHIYSQYQVHFLFLRFCELVDFLWWWCDRWLWGQNWCRRGNSTLPFTTDRVHLRYNILSPIHRLMLLVLVSWACAGFSAFLLPVVIMIIPSQGAAMFILSSPQCSWEVRFCFLWYLGRLEGG